MFTTRSAAGIIHDRDARYWARSSQAPGLCLTGTLDALAQHVFTGIERRLARSWSRTCTRMTAARKEPTPGRSSPTATCTAPPPPGPSWTWARCPPPPPGKTPPRTTSAPPNSPATNPAGLTADDTDGYHRVTCPATAGKLRCPLRPDSMTLDRSLPEILTPPQHPPACCTQQTLTIRPDIAAKTRQKHDYPSAAHRRSYARRAAAERAFSTIKDPASNTIARGWCRLMGLAPTALWLAALHAIRNQRILTTWNTRQAGNQRRAAAGLPPRTRKRRRKTTLASLTAPP